jgi:hypothetical protein
MSSTRKTILAALLTGALISAPALAQQSPEASLAQDLSSCAGAVAAVGNLDVVNYPRGASGEWAPLLGNILDALNREEGVEGMTGRYAASAAKDFWREQFAREREAAANECRARFGRG